ncbi:ATP-binding protein [Cyanobacterium aponinum FACHB-4101]|uniref:AAA family ATPase n=1 Tax=Cyanobacterium aponinum TaxID=379064 RepID=UPI001681984C|nr:AAA family ATPase [Cyanobacterium aponinum]MBD2393731.1 ATP-binding protein [Cyanobacterium aponinum FACHB-4101]
MKIHKIEYYDKEDLWELKPLKLHNNLNLLIGVSGAGKTTILRVIRSLKAIANGSSINGVSWNVCFSDEGESDDEIKKYEWSGEFELIDKRIFISDDSEEEEKKAKIVRENLAINGKEIVKRTESEIFFNETKTPKLSPFESVIDLLSQEDDISPIQKGLNKIFLTDSEGDFEKIWRLPLSILKKYEKYSFADLKESDLPNHVKLAIVYRIFPNEFNKIKSTFIDIFNNVLDLKIDNLDDLDIPIGLSQLLKEATTVSIKEKNVDPWIKNISSGMFKTLMYISQLFLSPNSSIILIDEFENSLGINCIDSVTDLILNNSNSQFIITSHHPYIINNISPAYWKIVIRKGSLVTVKNAKDYHIPDSRQKAFIDLINILEDEEEN